MRRIYLDWNSTTPLVLEAREAFLRACDACWGNPSSVHAEGQAARAAVEQARRQVAALIGARPGDLAFTSGATEANNAALRGTAGGREGRGRILVSAVEHPSVLAAAERAVADGCAGALDRVPVDDEGRVRVDVLEALLDAGEVALVAVMAVNNETGARQPLAAVAALCQAAGAPLLVDATQAVGREAFDVAASGATWVSFSAHKLGGPKGVGALWSRDAARGDGWLAGGHQERGRRPGTENLGGIAAFGAAAERARADLAAGQGWARVGEVRDRLWRALEAALDGVVVNGPPVEERAASTLNASFLGCAAESLLIALDLDGVAVSAGSACSAGSLEPSPVLRAMGIEGERLASAIRISVGPGTSPEDADEVAARIARCVRRLRGARA